MAATLESCLFKHAWWLQYSFFSLYLFQRAGSEWTPLWVQLKSVRSSLTSSVAMSTSTSTRHPPSHWTTPRCFSPMLAWTRYTIHASPHLSQISVLNLLYVQCWYDKLLCFLYLFLLVQTHLPQHHWSIPPNGQAASCCQHPKVYPCRRQTQRPGRCG